MSAIPPWVDPLYLVAEAGALISQTSNVRRIFGVPIHAATTAQTIELCNNSIQTQERLVIGVVNAAKIVRMQKQPPLRKAVLGADLVLADGMSVVWASRILGQPLPERVAGIDLFYSLLDLANIHNYRVYLLGAEQSVLDKVIECINEKYANVGIAGSQNGYFKEEESAEVAENIRKSNADILFVAITSPKKEVFLEAYGDMLDVPVCHGVGGTFDIMAGKVKRAPEIWQRLGIEWLYRTLQEPKRMWKRYLVTNSQFLWMLLIELTRKVRKPSHRAGKS